MKFNFSKNLGFTLVELLVVIAIIGILSSVAVVNLNSAREKAKVAAVEQTLAGIRPLTLLCFSANEEINGGQTGGDTCDGVSKPESGREICVGSGATWPSFAQFDGWDYCSCNSDAAKGIYEFSVGTLSCVGAGSIKVSCDQSSCSAVYN